MVAGMHDPHQQERANRRFLVLMAILFVLGIGAVILVAARRGGLI
jgi:hypothetical protein